MGIVKWDTTDRKLRARAKEELLRFMVLFSGAASVVCFIGSFFNGGDMRAPLILLTFLMIFMIAWRNVRRQNMNEWGAAKRAGREVFRIGMTQPTEAERNGIHEEPKKKKKTKTKTVKKGNFRH